MFNPAEKRDARGRWSLEQLIKTAIEGLESNVPMQHSRGLNYAKAAHEAATGAQKAHIGAALRSKRRSAAVAHLHDALNDKPGKPRTVVLGHQPHGLALNVAKSLVSEVRSRLQGKDKGAPDMRRQIARARASLPDGHAARVHLARAYHGQNSTSVMKHLGHAMRALNKAPLPDYTDNRHRRAAARRYGVPPR